MLTVFIFTATYLVLAIGRVPFTRVGRTGAAIGGALLMLATRAIAPSEAVRAIDTRTILLLLGMMALVAPLQLTGVLARVVVWVSDRVRHPAALVAGIAMASGALSAIFINDTICVAFTPLVLDLAALRRHDPVPYVLALATAANIGSAATIIGNPQNILIGSVSHIGFVRFTAALGPVALAGILIDVAILWVAFRRELTPHREDAWHLRRPHAAAVRHDLPERRRFPERPAPSAAPVFDLRSFVRAIDWQLLLLFFGLFIVVGAAERAGIDRRLFAALAPLGVDTIPGLSATTAILSNVVSNVPAVMLFTRIVPKLADPQRAWLTLAMASTLAGNLTILGSIANLIVVEGARRRGVLVTFWTYARVGVPITLLTIAFGMWWLD